MLVSLEVCGLGGLGNLNIDAEILGESAFVKPDDLQLYTQAQSGGLEIWNLGSGNGFYRARYRS